MGKLLQLTDIDADNYVKNLINETQNNLHKKDFDAVIPVLQKQIADIEDKITIYDGDHSKLATTIADIKMNIANIKNEFQADINKVLSNVDNNIASLNIATPNDLEQVRNNLLAQISTLKTQVDNLPTNSVKSLKWTKINIDSKVSVYDNLVALYLDHETDGNNYIQKQERIKCVEIKTVVNNKEKITYELSNGVKKITPILLWKEM